jgi:hypothetical protein
VPAKKSAPSKAPGAKDRDALLEALKTRFEANPQRHEGIAWPKVLSRLERNASALRALGEMERTGGEPDVTGQDGKTGEFIFCDCSKESPAGRRSVGYDPEALEARKKHPPADSALGMAKAMGGLELLDEEGYRRLQEVGHFDTTTSSWLRTPPAIRALGGAIFGDYRYGTVFIYHNGADSYYAARGFRCSLRV